MYSYFFTSYKKLHTIHSRILPIAFFMLPFSALSQTPITLKEALATAVNNNLSVNNERLKTEYAKQLIRTAANIPAIQASSELGQFNSSYFDTKVTISQSLSLPAVYLRQKQLFTQQWKAGMLNVLQKEFELKSTVTETFYNHLYLQQKEIILKSTDSLYAHLLQSVNLRLQKGESNMLEKATFENQRTAISLQLEQLNQQKLMIEELFKLLFNSDKRYTPSAPTFILNDQEIFTLETLQQHPVLKTAEQQQHIAKAITGMERSKLLPELMAGYSNTSFLGTGTTDKMNTAMHRFHSGQVGITIPVFTNSQKARIKASIINEKVVHNNYTIEKQLLQNTYLKNLSQFNHLKHMLSLYENEYIKSIHTIKEIANKQFLSGEINFLEFIMLTNQVITIQNGYVDLLKDYNQVIISMMYLNN